MQIHGSQTAIFHFECNIFGIHLIAVVWGPCTNLRAVEQDVKKGNDGTHLETTPVPLFTRLVYTMGAPILIHWFGQAVMAKGLRQRCFGTGCVKSIQKIYLNSIQIDVVHTSIHMSRTGTLMQFDAIRLSVA